MRKSILLFVLFALLNIPLMLFAQSGYKVKGHDYFISGRSHSTGYFRSHTTICTGYDSKFHVYQV